MSNQPADFKLPALVTVGFIIAGLIIAVIGGLSSGSIAGGIVAGLGIIPSMWAMFAGLQQKTQTGLAVAVLLFCASVGVGGLLILLRFVDWLR